MKTWKKLVSCLLVLSMIASMFVVVTAEEADQPEASDDPISYDNCVDANGNPLNPYIINNDIWVEENGGIKMPSAKLFSFLLFDTPLTTNRVEATFENITLSGSGDDRNGIAFALTDHNPGATLGGEGDANVSYYWACIAGWEGRIEVLKMGKYNGWEMISAGGWGKCGTPLAELGINPADGVTLAVEWDNEGHIKVFANGMLVEDITDPTGTPLTGNLYGIVTRRWANRPGSENPQTYTDTLTSFVTGDAKLAVNATAGEGGTVTEGGEFYRGQSATVTATPDEGYNFVGWYENDQIVSSEATYTFKVTGNRDLVAVFTNTAFTVTAVPGENGTVTGSGSYAKDTNATVVATPNVGYKFAGWFVGEELVYADTTYTFTVTEDCTLTAKFEKAEYTVTVDGQGNPLNPYFVNGVTWVEENGMLKMPAGVENSFLLFDNALANNRVEATIVINDNTFGDANHRNGIVFALDDIGADHDFWYSNTDVSYYWAFVNDWGCLQLWEMGANGSWGTAFNGGPSVDLNATYGIDLSQGVTIAAEWDANGNIKVFANGNLVFDVVDETPLTGNLYGLLVNKWGNTQGPDYVYPYNAPVTSFVAGGTSTAPDVNVTVTVDPVEGGTVEGAGDYYANQSVTLTATETSGYKFVGWYEGEELVCSDKTYVFVAEANRNLTAVFTNVTYMVNVVSATNGSVTGSGIPYGAGAEVTLTATPNNGYRFVGWFEMGSTEPLSTDAIYKFIIEKNYVLQAKFEKITSYSVAVDGEGNLLNPVFVNDIYWELTSGELKMPFGTVQSFLLFDTPLANNRVEATIAIRDTGIWGDVNRRNGIVFAFSDNAGDGSFLLEDTDISYYWAFVDDWNCLHVYEMSAAQQWADLTTYVNLPSLGIDVTQGVSIAAEWDADGHIKVYANGALVMDFVDETPLAGNLYGLLVNNYGNFDATYGPCDGPVTSFVAGGELVWAEPEVPEVPTAPESYENCVDGEGNLLNPVFVNDIYWELSDGELKMPFGTDHSFLLFDNELANNRVEVTIAIRDTGIWGDGNRRNGIVFAFSDNAGDGSFLLWDTDISYYWVFVDDWNCLHIYEMSASQQWADLTSYVDLPSLGIDVTQGVTIAAEWDADGNIKVFANGALVMDFVDETPLAGNLYGLLVNNYGNFDAAYGPCDGPVTSFVAGGALATKDVNVDVTAEGGTVTGAGDYYLGQNVTLTATANDGYKFLGWYAGEELVSKEATINFVATEDRALTAKFISFDEYQHILVESTETNLGEEVVVTLVIKNNPGIAGLVVSLNYNADVLTLIGAENGTLFSGFTWADNMLWDEAFNVTEDGVLVTLTFAVAEGAEVGDYTIEVIVRECYDENIEDVDLVTIGGTVTVNDAPDIMWGDVNEDGVIDTRDITRLKKYVANYDDETGTSTETVGAGADANGDGVIDTRDITRLKKYVANYDDETGTSTEVLGPQ